MSTAAFEKRIASMKPTTYYSDDLRPYDPFNGRVVSWMPTAGLTKANPHAMMALYQADSIRNSPLNYTSWPKDPIHGFYWPQVDQAYAQFVAAEWSMIDQNINVYMKH